MKPYAERLQEAITYTAACEADMKHRPVPSGQKYPPGTRVHIVADLGPMMRHFESDRDATVLYTYLHMYGHGSAKSYCLDIDGRGAVSWYYEHQLVPLSLEAT